MDKRFVVGIFAGFVALGVVYGLMAVVMGTPAQTPPAYTVANSGDADALSDTLPPGVDASSAASTGGPTGGTGATGSAGATASAGSTATADLEEEAPAPDQPARVGEPLKSMANMPPGTVAMLEPSAASAGSAYDVTFAPFGIGLQDASQAELVVKILASAPRDPKSKNFAFSSTNVLAIVAGGLIDKVQKGGVYKATLTLADRSGLLVPELSDITVLTVRK